MQYIKSGNLIRTFYSDLSRNSTMVHYDEQMVIEKKTLNSFAEIDKL